MSDRPEGTNTGGWYDAEDDPLETCSGLANLLGMMENLHDLDIGQRLMLRAAIDALAVLGEESDEGDEVEPDEDEARVHFMDRDRPTWRQRFEECSAELQRSAVDRLHLREVIAAVFLAVNPSILTPEDGNVTIEPDGLPALVRDVVDERNRLRAALAGGQVNA